MLDEADKGVELCGHCVGIFDEKARAVENEITFVGYVGFAVGSNPNGGRKAKVAKRAVNQRRGHRNDFNG